MTRETFKAFRRACRKAGESRQLRINGRNWAIGRGGCDRLEVGGGWHFDRPEPAERALRLEMVGFMRRRFGIKSRALVRAA